MTQSMTGVMPASAKFAARAHTFWLHSRIWAGCFAGRLAERPDAA
jgi:hypothetical protein